MNATDSGEVLKLLLADRTPEEQVRLQAAWEKYAAGDPESAPAFYALAQLFVMDAHAAMLDRQAELLERFQGICQNERRDFEEACASERKATLDGFEKRQAAFEQDRRVSVGDGPVEVPMEKGTGVLAIAACVAFALGLLGGGFAMNRHNQKQFREATDVGQKMVKAIRDAGGNISHRVTAAENGDLFQVVEITAPEGKPKVFLTVTGHGAVTFKQPKP